MSYIIRIIKHKLAYIKTEYAITKKISINGIIHDTDKILLYLLFWNREKVSNIHRAYSKHHEQNNDIKDKLGAIIDWECSRYSKPEAQLNAKSTYLKYYKHIDGIDSILRDLKLW